MPETVEERLNGRHKLALFCPNEQAYHTHHIEFKILRCPPPRLFIDQYQIGLKLQRQSNGFSLAGVKFQTQCIDSMTVDDGVHLDPRRLFGLPRTRPGLSAGRQFSHHSMADMQAPKQALDQVKLADGSQVC